MNCGHFAPNSKCIYIYINKLKVYIYIYKQTQNLKSKLLLTTKYILETMNKIFPVLLDRLSDLSDEVGLIVMLFVMIMK